jgi:hypothetical protein
MTGYRDKTAIDPLEPRESGPSRRPFNAVQWIGFGFLVLGAVMIVVTLLGHTGAIPKIGNDDLPFVGLMPLGAVLMSSRRQRTPCDPEALRRRRIAIVVLALAAAVLGAVLAILLATGA